MEDYTYSKLVEYALKLISKKRYTEKEIVDRLERRIKKVEKWKDIKIECKEDIVKKVINRLKQLKYVDDSCFARDYVSDRVRFRPRGKLLIRRELKYKGVSEEIADKALEDIEINEFDMAKELINKVAGRWKKYSHFKQREKAYQYLYSKGFMRDTIYKILESCYDRA